MNEVTIIDPKEYGLDEKQAESIISKLNQIVSERVELFEEYERVIELDVTKTDKDVFKRVRLSISNNRTKQLEPARKADKELFLRGGQFVDASYKREITENERREAVLLEKEKFFERQEAERIEQLNTVRLAELQPYMEFVPAGVNFGSLSDADYSLHLNGAKMQYDAKVAEEARLEAERLEAEKQEQERAAEELRIEELHKSRKDIALPFFDFWSEFEKTLHFGTVSESDFNAFIDRIKNEKVENDQKIEAQRIENERLKAEQDKAKLEAEKQAEIQAKKDAEIQSKLEAERKENERIQAELDAKNEAGAKAEQQKLEAENKAKLEAEKLAKAPVKQQMKNWVDSFELPCPLTDTDLSAEIITKFEAFKTWAKTQIENL
jgi:hypothetical protein